MTCWGYWSGVASGVVGLIALVWGGLALCVRLSSDDWRQQQRRGR